VFGGSGNCRNGFTAERLGIEVGDIDLATPRDRDGSFELRLVPKGQRRVGGLSDMIISLYTSEASAHAHTVLVTHLLVDFRIRDTGSPLTAVNLAAHRKLTC